MKITFNTGIWTEIKRDNENNIIISGCDEAGNEFEIGFKNHFPESKWFRIFIEDSIKLMSISDKLKILKKLKVNNEEAKQ